VATRTQELRDACGQVLTQKADLVAAADRLRARLVHYDNADRLATQVGTVALLATTNVTVPTSSSSSGSTVDVPIPLPSLPADEFVVLLQRLDECLVFLAANVCNVKMFSSDNLGFIVVD
jgi:hypothetical protein